MLEVLNGYVRVTTNFCRTIGELLDEHRALVKQFSKMLEFVLKFDECKMTTPAVQNDFSYYRSVGLFLT